MCVCDIKEVLSGLWVHASLIPRLSACFTLGRAWYFFSCDLTYILVRGLDHSKDCCSSLPFAGDSV